MDVAFTVNGKKERLTVQPADTLLHLLRERLLLTGTKEGCGTGQCGACTVVLDGQGVNACLVLAADLEGRDVWTIEGVAEGETLHPLQQAFIDHYALQCGFCTPGMIMEALALLRHHPNPTREEIKESIKGNMCRCTGYARIVAAIQAVAEKRTSR